MNSPIRDKVRDLEHLIPPGALIVQNSITGDYDPKLAENSFREYGVNQVDDWVRRGYILPTSNVVDVGCGLGRVARPLASYLRDGKYIGFDIVKASIDWCQKAYWQFENFSFVWADLANSHYNRQATDRASKYRFPVPDAFSDFLWSTSVFTHMRLDEIDNYLGEMVRVAKPGSLLWNTYFLLDEISEPLARAGIQGGLKVQHEIEGGLYIVENSPDTFIAFSLDRIKDLHAKHGLEIIHIGLANWSGRPGCSINGQDVILCRKSDY